MLCLLYIPVTYVFNVLLGLDLGEGNFLRYNGSQALNSLLNVLMLTGLSLGGLASPSSFALATVVAALGVLGSRASALMRCGKHAHICLSTLRQVVARGWQFSMPELAGLALLRIDYVLLVRMVSPEALGLYAVSLAVATGQAATANPVAQVCFHTTSSARTFKDSISTLSHQFRLFQVLFALITATSLLVSPLVVRIAFGPRYLGAITTTQILIVAMAVWSCSQLLDNGLRGAGYPHLCTWSNLFALVTLLIVARLMVRQLGIDGMAIAMGLGQSVSLAAKFFLLKRSVGCRLSDFWGFDKATLAELGALSRRLAESILGRC
jgi:O-antigen/teichoic acid export membrane protein